MSIQVIEAAREGIRVELGKLVEEATSVVDEYWIEFRLMNKKLRERELREKAPEGYLRGNYGPRIVERTGKTYIEWVFYGPGRYGARKKSWGDRVPPRKGPVYHESQFTAKAQPWELELILEAENKLRPLRYSIEEVHRCQAYLSRLLAKLRKQHNVTLENKHLEKEHENV